MRSLLVSVLPLLVGMISTPMAFADGDEGLENCLEVDLAVTAMWADTDWAGTDEACPVAESELRDDVYPFTLADGYNFNCELAGPFIELPLVGYVPTAVKGTLVGTIGGHDFQGTVDCSSMENGQLLQPFLMKELLPYPRLTEVSIFEGDISVAGRRGKEAGLIELPLTMVTRGIGIMHIEANDPGNGNLVVGASITHSLLGLSPYRGQESITLLMQGHIFNVVGGDDLGPDATVKGLICSEALSEAIEGGDKGRRNKDDDDD